MQTYKTDVLILTFEDIAHKKKGIEWEYIDESCFKKDAYDKIMTSGIVIYSDEVGQKIIKNRFS